MSNSEVQEPKMDVENSQFCVNIFCVMPSNSTEATCPKDLFQAHECCKENGFNVNWIQEEACMKLKPCKEDVFILSEFVGPLFEFLRHFRCTIIGPQCLLVSVNKGEPLPDVPTPVFTVAMKGIIVTTTGCSPQEKKDIQEKVQFMGGLYSSAFSVNVTHLIVKSVADFSLKFKVAISRDVPVMVPNWVDAVWNASIKESVHGTDPMFARYACPPFQGLVICVSQIPIKDREALKKIIEANGGRYSGQLEMGKTNILITTSAEGEKYTYARRWKIRCLKPEWIHTSLNKGYAVDPDAFIVEKSALPPRCSTPEADHSVMKFGNSSINSTILNESRVQQIDETVGSTTLILNHQQCDLRSSEALESLDLAISKKAGPFLDGCKVFLSGFDGSPMEKLRRILNNAGVARFNSISESLSHVIVGKTVEEDWKQLQQLMHKPHIVTVEWVVQSLRLKRAAPEAAYLHPDFKNVIAPNKENAAKKPIRELSSNLQEDTHMVQQYLTTDHTEEEASSLMDRPQGIFFGLTFQLVNLDTDFVSTMTDLIVSNGGLVVLKNATYVVTEPVSHTIVPLDQVAKGTLVNTLWIEECVDEGRLVDIEFYHHHIKVRDRQILAGYTVSFSGIQGRLRELLDDLIGQLGGRPQETFSRKLMEQKNVYRSTHLVCAKTEGRKYEKALEWGVPAVSAEWVIACATSSSRPNEDDFPPTGEAPKSPESDVPTPQTAVKLSVCPTESVVLKTTKQKLAEISSNPTRHLPTHFDMSSPRTPTGPSVTPVMPQPPAAFDSPMCMQPSSSGTNTVGRTPQPRTTLFNMPTPDTPYGRLLNSDPSPDTRKMWKHALENRVRLTPRTNESFTTTPQQEIQRGEIIVASEASDYFENLRKKFRLDNGEDGQTTWGSASPAAVPPLEPPKQPFEGIVVFIHKKIEDQRSELVRAVETLGGKVRFQHCEEVTHFVYQGKLAASKEVKNAKEWHQKFVSPQWILDCEDATFRLEESQYPPSLNPKMALSLNFNSQPPPPASCTQKRRPIANIVESGTPKIPIRKRLTSDIDTHENDHLEVDEGQNLPVPEVDEEACKELLQLDQVLSRSAEQIPVVKLANVSAARNGRAPDRVFVPATQPLDMAPDSQSAAVVWDLHETQKITGSEPAPVYRVMFSGMAQDDRDCCTAIIENLGGTVLEANHYDPTCTHLVVAKVGSNEKLLTSIAAGKWILHPEWLSESEKEHRFLEEQKYEWGNPEASAVHPQVESISEDEAKIAAAAYYWRINRTRGHSDGPFHGITAVLHLREKNASFQRLLEAGGGEVVDPISALENSRTNLCILDTREVKKIQLATYASKGIYCVPLIYLRNLVLATDKKLKWSKSVLPEFLPYLENMPS
ncbi:hypothetical protein OUZ56_000592 [Daphnia magna]|uniref:BRCT domain-containing protein n=1 Tax=Daphnia magna TaxID=35525 RepID=A0ABR0A059_9CRUS|nr:hypothetical protein OUZ56_000592 [Daphnia magna]